MSSASRFVRWLPPNSAAGATQEEPPVDWLLSSTRDDADYGDEVVVVVLVLVAWCGLPLLPSFLLLQIS